MHAITLTKAELYMGAVIGSLRRIASLQNGNNPNRHAQKSDWATDIDGAHAEQALSKYLGIYWFPGINTFKAPDLINGLQVRSTNHANGHLIIRPNDDDYQTFVLVVCQTPIYRLMGSLMAIEAKTAEYFHKGEVGEADCWWVPQGALGDLPEPVFLYKANEAVVG